MAIVALRPVYNFNGWNEFQRDNATQNLDHPVTIEASDKIVTTPAL